MNEETVVSVMFRAPPSDAGDYSRWIYTVDLVNQNCFVTTVRYLYMVVYSVMVKFMNETLY